MSKNPHYQFYENCTEYERRCRISDPMGYNVMFNEDIDELHETMDTMDEYQLRDVVD